MVLRPAEIAGDTASQRGGSAARAGRVRGRTAHRDVVLLVQCTSPFLTREDIDGVAAAVAEDGADTALTRRPLHGFLWRGRAGPGAGGRRGQPRQVRPAPPPGPAPGLPGDRRRLRDGRRGLPRAARHRFFGRTALVRTDPARVLEIDDPHDLARARALAPLLDADRPAPDPRRHRRGRPRLRRHPDRRPGPDRRRRTRIRRRAPRRRTRDRRPARPGLRAPDPVHRDRTRSSPPARANSSVPVLHGIDRKDLALKQWCEEQGIAPERVLYVGNDVNDLPCFAPRRLARRGRQRPRRRTRRRPRGHHHPRRRRRDPRDRRLAPRPLSRPLPKSGTSPSDRPPVRQLPALMHHSRLRTLGSRPSAPASPSTSPARSASTTTATSTTPSR